MTEVQLAAKFIDYFAGFDIYKEVPTRGSIIDIVVDGVCPAGYSIGLRIGIEVKCNLNFDVIEQAINQRKCFHYTYIAVPCKYRPHAIARKICEQYGIGILGYNKISKTVMEHVNPKLNRKPLPVELQDYMKRSVAGSQNERITSWGYFVEHLTETVRRRKDGITVEDCYKQLEHKHYKTLSLFKNSTYKYINHGIIKNIVHEKGRFYYREQEAIQGNKG